jgi:hypothetical protein
MRTHDEGLPVRFWTSVAVSVVWLAAGGCGSAGAASDGPAPGAGPQDPGAVVAEVPLLYRDDLWPGFDPRRVPVAVHDGERTLLFHHPAPPEPFRALAGREGVHAMEGRHPQVVANSSILLGGVPTATLLPAPEGATLRERAGLLVHEIFHVHQREHFPSWIANEVELFVYPVEDARLLALRRLETEALRRALAGAPRGPGGCWAARALALRTERFASLPPGSVEYERKSELNEGLATYVEHRALGTPDAELLPERSFGAAQVRERSYWSGLVLGRLLDRLHDRWREALSADPDRTLDGLLGEALARRGESGGECLFDPLQRASAEHRARAEVQALRDERAERRRAFLERPGWTLVIEAAGSPLWPQGFDPLNVHVLGAGEVLHTRFLLLGNDDLRFEVVDRASLTRGVGAHPLFEGVGRVLVTGLDTPPEVEVEGDVIRVRHEGLSLRSVGGEWHREGRTTTVRLRR